MTKVVIDASCLKSLGGSSSSYDDTAILERLKKLENRTDNFVKDVTVSREGNKVKFKYTRVDGTSSEAEFDDKDTIAVAYDDTNLRSRVEALEAKPDKDTIYDDTALAGRVTTLETSVTDNKQAQDTKNSELEAKDRELEGKIKALEAKEDNDKQTLSLVDHTLSISNGNSVELPKYDDSALKAKGTEQDEAINALKEKTKSFLTGASLARHDDVVTLTYTNIDGTSTNLEFNDHDTKALAYDDTALKARVQELENKTDKDTKYNVKSATSGVTVTKSQENDENVFTINADEALKNLASKDEVAKAIAENNKQRAQLSVTYGTFKDESKFSYGFSDRKPAFSYNDVTHFGTFKVDGFIHKHLEPFGAYIADMPVGSPKPVDLLEQMVYINNNPVTVYVNRDGSVKANGITDDMFGKRIVMTFVGLFA